MAAKELSYINNDGAYSVWDGGAPNVQNLIEGQYVQNAYISHNINVAENNQGSNFKKFERMNHSYYTIDDGTYVVETENNSEATTCAVGLPEYLTGWQLANGDSFNEAGSLVDSNFISRYFSEDVNLNVYGVWGNTKFLRVIVSTFNTAENAMGTFTVELSNSASYDTMNDFRLSPKFKYTVDYSNVEKHLTLKNYGQEGGYTEVGSGHGCKRIVDGVQYPSYFGFKSNTTTNFSLTVANSNYIPYYDANPLTSEIVYKGKLCEDGLSRDYNDKGTSLVLTTSNNSTWTTSLSSLTSDRTIFIRLVSKPAITAVVQVQNTGNIEITNTSTQPSVINQQRKTVAKFPGESCYLWARPETGYSFVGWFVDPECTTPVESDGNHHPYTSPEYDITFMYESRSYYAKFASSDYTITYHKE